MKLCMGCMENIDDQATTCPHCGYNEKALRQESYYLSPGTIVGGKYIVGRVLSYGGYTVSYLGMDAEKNRKVTVKEYLPSDFSTRAEGETEVTIYSGDALEQFNHGLTTFLNEANRIQHLENTQGIARVYDCLAENDTGYVISEYLEGRTLKEILDQGKRYTPQEAKEFVCQILIGLSQVHPLDIIHCDIAPETIMVTNTGEIKLLDFGATRYVTTANSKSLAIILKQGYAPEEQYRSKGVRGPWTDVYALGAVMYRMITGKVPEESVDRALVDELKEPSKLGVDIPENMENALMNALNVYQSERTQSAADFLRELRATQVKRIQVKKRKNDTGKFPKWAKGLVACLLCLALAGGIAAFMMWPETEDLGENKQQKMVDLTDKTIQEAQDFVKEQHYDQYGIKVQVVPSPDFVYDSDKSKNGRICKQEGVQVSQDLKNNQSYTVKCTVYSSEKIHYSDLIQEEKKTPNAKIIQTTMNLPDTMMEGIENTNLKTRHMYWDLKQISLGDEQLITEEELTKEENANKQINVSDISKIQYFQSAFLYWEKMPVFKKGDVLTDKDKGKLYIYGKDGKTPEETRQEIPIYDSGNVDKNFYSFILSKYEIIEQLVTPGTKYNPAEGSEQYFLKIVGQNLSAQGTVKELHDKLSEFMNVEFKVNGELYDASKDNLVIQKEVAKDSSGKEVEVFQKNVEEKYIIEITAVVPSTPEPTPAPAQETDPPTQRPVAEPKKNPPPKPKTNHSMDKGGGPQKQF